MTTVAVSTNLREVRLVNTHNVLTRTRPLNGTANIGEVAIMNSSGEWEKADGVSNARGIFLGFTDGRVNGLDGDDAEVLMEGIVNGFTVAPDVVVYDAGDGTLDTTGSQKVGVGLNDNLLYIRPDL